MSTIVIVGCGNIGYRHLQAAVATRGVDRVVVVEPRSERQSEILATIQADVASVSIVSALEDAAIAIAEARLVVVAVTADAQPGIAARLAELGPAAVLLEKPVAQSSGLLAAVSGAFEDRYPRGGVYVNCARSLFTGWRYVREVIGDMEPAIEMRVAGDGWGYGCNAIHFIEVFRFVTGAGALRCIEADLEPAPGGSKRGERFAEYVGSASFGTASGDRLAIECGAGSPAMAAIEIQAVGSGARLISIDEAAGVVVDHRTSERLPLGAVPVSGSTGVVIERLLRGSAPGLPTLRETAESHGALFASLARATGKRIFAIT